MNPEDNIFDVDEYYNYNEILSSYFNRQYTPITYDGIKDSINSIVSSEK